jgi:prophage regulatory protein
MQQLKIYRKKDLCRILGVSATTLDRWMREGSFPPAIRISSNIIGWPASSGEDWLDSLPQNDTEVRSDD